MTISPKSIISDLWATSAVEQLFDSSGIGFMIVTPDRAIIDANCTFCEMIGYPLEKLVTMTIVDLTHPDDLNLTQKLFQRARESNVIQTFEKRYVTSDGRDLWCKLRTEGVTDDDGIIVYRIVMVEDITADKRNELFMEQMAAIVESSDDAIFRSDLVGNIHFWSKGAERLYGYSADEVLGRHLSFLLADEDERLIVETMKHLMRGETVSYQDEMAQHKDGHLINVSAQVFPLRDKHGDIIAIAAVHRDIGKLKQLEEQLRLSQRMETAGMLAGSIAHDFNNILTVIRGSCEVIADELPGLAQQGRNLDRIERAADRATSLTRQLLAFSRRQQSAPEIMDPCQLLEKLMPILHRALGEDIVLNTQLQSSWLIREDPTQLEQIILNLSVNARHAMPDGGRLLISTEDIVVDVDEMPAETGWDSFSPTPPAPGCYVRLSVCDTGTGMSRDILERIFEPFYSTKDKSEGTGLGLAVVYGMVTQVRGGIQVCSRRGTGSNFHIFLPKVG
jgi:PAS domain S-box-containing protein